MKFNINFMTSLFLLLPFCSPANEIYDCKAVGGSVLDNVRKRASPQGNIQKWTSC